MADSDLRRARLYRFGAFELDVRAGELRRHGILLPLREQPLQVLLLLLERPGEIVLQEEIRRKLWPNDTIVEFDRAVDAATKELRDALGESADKPRHIETVGSGGYRFLGRVEVMGEAGDLEGKTISHYRVLEKLGSGGMGVVFRAKDLTLQRHVALKFLPEEYSPHSQILERFQREARAAAALNHPNICTIYEIGEYHGQPFIAMELLEGQTIKDRLTGTPFQWEELINLAMQMAEALEVAHARGIVHRDIKPANLFVTRRGQVKVLDFGLAKLLPDQELHTVQELTGGEGAAAVTAATDLTTPGALVGTVAYMSPEQARSEGLDARTDLFSFGAVLYEMATGRRAFHGSTMPVILAAIIYEAPASPILLNPDLPVGLAKIIDRMLEKDREMRYQSAAEIRTDLQVLKRGIESGRTAGLQTAAAPTSEAEQVQSVRASGTATRKSRRPAILWAALLLMAASVGVGWLIVRRPGPPRQLTPRRLTANPENLPVESAAISPDGKYLGYSDERGVHLQLLATGETQSIPRPSVADGGPRGWEFEEWYPDSMHFTATLKVGWKTSLWAVSILAGAPQKLIDSEGSGGVVSPDGSHIADVRRSASDEIWLMGPQGESPRMIMAAGDASTFYSRISWSPAGDRIAYSKYVAGRQSVESCDLNGKSKSTIFSGDRLDDFAWISPRRFIYSESTELQYMSPAANLWELKVDLQTGTPQGKPRQLTHWSGFYARSLSATLDAKHLAFLRETDHWSMFVADITTDGTHLDGIHQLPDDDYVNISNSWNADSRSVIFASDRGGTLGIYRQALDGTAPQIVSASPLLDALRPQLSPDGSSVIFVAWPHSTASGAAMLSGPAALYRAKAGGTAAYRLLEVTEPGLNFASFDLHCTNRAGGFCAYGFRSEDRRVLTITSFDPVTGKRKESLRIPTEPSPFCGWALSPDGLRIAVTQMDQKADQIRFIPLHGGDVRTIQVKGYSSLGSINWDPTSKGLFVSAFTTLLHVDMNGSVQPIWQHPVRGELVGDVKGIPSPDGRHIALTGFSSSADVWLIDNF